MKDFTTMIKTAHRTFIFLFHAKANNGCSTKHVANKLASFRNNYFYRVFSAMITFCIEYSHLICAIYCSGTDLPNVIPNKNISIKGLTFCRCEYLPEMTRNIARPFQSADFTLCDTDFLPRHKTALKQSIGCFFYTRVIYTWKAKTKYHIFPGQISPSF